MSVAQVPCTRELLATAQAGGCDQVSPTAGILGVRCDLATGTCSQHDVRNTPGERAPHLLVDQAKARTLMVITDDTKQGTASVLACGLDLLGCSKTVIGSGEWQSELRLAPLPNSGQIYVTGIHETTERGVVEPLVTTCDAKGTNCSARFVFASVPPGSHYGLDAKRSASGALTISSVSAGRVVRSECPTPSQPCGSVNIGDAPAAADGAYLGSALMLRPGGTNVVMGTPSGASLFTCANGQPCSRVELPIFSAAGAAPLWTTALADDAHNAFYVALFRQGIRLEQFSMQVDIAGSLEVYRCSNDGGACERAVSRRDIQVATFYPKDPPVDSLSWGGRPASLSLGPDGVLRAAVTDGTNLFRPVIIELDSY